MDREEELEAMQGGLEAEYEQHLQKLGEIGENLIKDSPILSYFR